MTSLIPIEIAGLVFACGEDGWPMGLDLETFKTPVVACFTTPSELLAFYDDLGIDEPLEVKTIADADRFVHLIVKAGVELIINPVFDADGGMRYMKYEFSVERGVEVS